eukprot:6494008-Prymnesium_polylepis.1
MPGSIHIWTARFRVGNVQHHVHVRRFEPDAECGIVAQVRRQQRRRKHTGDRVEVDALAGARGEHGSGHGVGHKGGALSARPGGRAK